MTNKYVPLFGGTLMSLAFFSTVRVSLNNPSTTNVLISLALFAGAAYGFFKFFTAKEEKKKEKQESTIPLYN